MLLLLEDSWERVQADLRERVGGATYTAWLEGLRPLLLESSTVYLEAKTKLAADRVRALFRGTLSEVLSKDFGTELKVEIQAREAENFDALEVSPQRPVIDDGNRTAFLVLKSLLPDRRRASQRGGDGGSAAFPAGGTADGTAATAVKPRWTRASARSDGHVSGLLDAAGVGEGKLGRPIGGLQASSPAASSPAASSPEARSPEARSAAASIPKASGDGSGSRSARFAAAIGAAEANRLVPASLYVFHGAPGVGKTFLLRWWREQLPKRSMWFDLPDLLKAFQCAHQEQRIDQLSDELCADVPLVLDEVHRIAHKPALQSFVMQVLQAREANGSATILSSRWHPRDVRHLDASLGSQWLAGFVCSIERPGPLGRLRYLRALEGSPSRNGRAPQVEALAQQVTGSYPELRAAWAASRGETLPPRYLELIDPSRVFQRCRDRVAERFSVSKDDLVGKGQGRALSRARKIMALLCQQQGLSGGEIGRFLGRTRAAVSYMLLSLQTELDKSPDLRAEVEELT